MPPLPSTKVALQIAAKASGKRVGIRWYPVAVLIFDPVINRDYREAWAQEIAETFNPDAFGLILVNVRTGEQIVVIDGQHRVKAYLPPLQDWMDQQVECEVFEGLTTEEEAALFVLRNKRRGMTHMETFLKLITAGDPETLSIVKVVQDAGLCVHKQSKDGHITASVVLQKIYRGDRLVGPKQNPKALGDALGTLVATWGKEKAALKGALIHGLGLLFLREAGRVDKVALASKLGLFPGGPTKLLALAKNNAENHSRTVPYAVAGTIADLYNKGRTRRVAKLLSWWAE